MYQHSSISHTLKKAHARKLMCCIVLSVVGILFYLYSAATPMYADDYTYTYSFADGSRIQSVWDIFPSMAGHYHQMNGRLVPHFLAQLFLLLGRNCFNVINTLVFLGLGLLIYLISAITPLSKNSAARLALIFILLYWIPPAFGESFLWLDASATYHTGILLILLAFYPYWRVLKMPNTAKAAHGRPVWDVLTVLGNSLLGVLVGFVSENVSIALIGMTVILMIYFFYRRCIRPWMTAGLAGQIIGYIVMLRAPGNAQRLVAIGREHGMSVLLQRFESITERGAEYLCPLLLLFFATLLLYFLLHRGEPIKQTIQMLFPTAVLTAGAIMSAYSMIATPYFPGRAWNGTVVLSVAAYVQLLDLIDWQDLTPKGFTNLLIAGAAVCALVSWRANYSVLLDIQAQYNARTESIQEQLSQGATELYVNNIHTANKYSCFSGDGDVGPDFSNWTNTALARYWNVREVHLIGH